MNLENKYLSIYHDLVNKIENNDIKANDMLPSENELVSAYETSRETVRKALNLLSQNGYIQKIKGKGSIVLETKRFNFPISGLVSFKELAQKMGREPKTIVEELTVIKPDLFLTTHLDTDEDDEIWKVMRVRQIGSERIILDKDFFKKKYVTDLTIKICEDSIYEYIEHGLGLKIGYAKKVISVQEATEEDRNYLDLGAYNMVVVVENYVCLNDTTLFQYTESRHRPDKFKFVDFARRIHNT
ncbi:trehalose operon repressor [Paenibacillus tyrfis]|uniref:trehalose operon repressor n=1 Tax=Paenibacillus tyrfis TaxID=1501230 RepID=UPI00209E2AE6|nr:trehalose operon repressor [Paenibacillus tyrfis]MCP1308613.1 trehalose operon repressor [Paenibacillus tyrfis]